jgi:DNA-binding NarL/FixJ family response regulator
MRNREIGPVLGASEATVKFYVTHIFTRLRVKSRTEALGKAIELGIVMP